MWDSLYGLGIPDSVRQSLDNFTDALLKLGGSPVATNAGNLQAVYDYFRRQGSDWNPTDPLDSLAVRVGASYGGNITGSSSFTNEDRSHVDGYLPHPSRTNFGGAYPSDFTTLDEDVSSGRAVGDYRASNATMVTGPPTASAIDLTGTGWTSATGLRRLNWNHELVHALPGGANSGVLSELWSAGAEAVGGIYDTTATDEMPYHWPLLSFIGAGPSDCGTSGFSNRWAGSNYQGRTSFMAYIAYNFLNGDTARTLAGMRDDLMFRWRRQPNPSVFSMRTLLSDDSCATCSQMQHFRHAGGGLTNTVRLGVLHHNWRVANFVNSVALAEGQYGWPAWSGFSPARHQRAWQAFDGCDASDIVAVPPSLELTSAHIDRDTTLKGWRSFRGAEMPLAVAPYAAAYWVIRAGAGTTSADRELLVRITPTASFSCGNNNNIDARVFANLVGYTRVDSGGAEPDLWRHPEAAALATSVDSMLTDSLDSRVMVLRLPGFGSTRRAALLTISTADGKASSYAGGDMTYEEAFPYRLDVRLVSAGSPWEEPLSFSSVPTYGDAMPAWSWSGDEVAYSVLDSTVSSYPQIYRRELGSSSAVRVAPQAMKQFAPDWSPRRDRIAFEVAPTNSESAIYTLAVDSAGATPIALTHLEGCETMPAYQPDGQGIAYLHINPADARAYLRWVSANGSNDHIIDTLGTYTTLPKPRWSADGSRILVPLENHGWRVHWAWRWGSEFVEEPTIGMPVTALDFHPGRGRALVSTNLAITNRAYKQLAVPPCATSSLSRRVALLDTAAATRDTSYRRQHLNFFQDRAAWSKRGTHYAYEQRDRVVNDVDLFVDRVTWDRAPVLAFIADQQGETAEALSFALSATDADGDPIDYGASTLPAGAGIGSSGFRWSEPAAGIHYAIIRATDPHGAVDTRVVKLTIQHSVPPCEPFCGGGGGEHDPLSRRGDAGGLAMLPSQLDLSERNTFLDGVAPGTSARQLASLPELSLDATGEQYAVRLTTGARGGAFIDAMRLHVADHAEDVQVVAGLAGLIAGTPEQPVYVIDDTGVDLGAILDSGEGVLMAPGAMFEFRWAASDATRGLAVECERAADAVGSGVTVQVLEAGAWRTLRTIHARRHRDTFGASATHIERARLVADKPTRLLSVHRLVWRADAPSPTATSVIEASRADGIESTSALATEDGDGLTLTEESPARVLYPAPPLVEGMRRSFYLDVAGRYSQASSAVSQQAATGPELPREFALGPAVPNPSSGQVSFAVDLPRASAVRLEVLDAQGRLVHTIVREERAAGRYRFTWDGTTSNGRRMASGLYYARLRASEFTATRTVVSIP